MPEAAITSRPSSAGQVRSGITRVVHWDGAGLFIAFAILFAALSLTAPNFLSVDNMFFLVQQAAFFGIVALAMTLVIIAGEIDVSVGSHAALSSAMLGVLVIEVGLPMWLACVIVLVGSVGIGAFAGWIRATFDVPSFIVTLALFLALRGLALMVTQATPIPIPSEEFFYWGTGRIGGVPASALYMAVYLMIVFVVVGFLAKRTVFGRSVYAVGGNAHAAELSGVKVKRVQILVFVITGLSAGIVGILLSAQLASGTSSIGIGLEFDAIAAVIIGGTLLSGGKGTVSGTLLGAFFIALVTNGMVLIGLDQYAQQVVRGALVLAAVLISALRQRRSVERAV